MLDKKEFVSIMAVFSDMCKRKMLTQTLDAYYAVLKKYSTEQFKSAARRIMETHKFSTIPMPAEFIECIEGGLTASASDAWIKVLNSIRSGHGGYTGCKLSDKVINAFGGLYNLETEQIPYTMSRFISLYKDYAPKMHTQKILENKTNKDKLEKICSEIG